MVASVASPRGAAAAATWARGRVGTKGYGGMCLQFTRLAHEVGPKYGHARLAWQRSRQHRTSSTAQMPVGVPIWLDKPGSKYGHVAVYVGNGQMVTTRASTNRIHLDSVDLWRSWGWRVLGWSEDINGVRVWSPPSSSGTGSSGASSSKPSAKADPNVARYRVAVDTLRVRAKPSTSAKVVNRLRRGAVFTVPRGSGTVAGSGLRWLRTTRGNFVAAKYVRKVD